MPGLQIPYARERALVAAADLAIRPLAWGRGGEAGPVSEARRVLLLRLERIGDLLMTREAIADACAAWPSAEIDLAVGSWNLPVARLIPGLSRVHTADVPWLARDGGGHGWSALAAAARRWRRHGYDVAVNFEPDIRSNALAWRTRARRRFGYWTGGGGAFLTDAAAFVPTLHTADNARVLIARASGRPVGHAAPPPLVPPPAEAARAQALVHAAPRPLVGVHASGGRPSKQWHIDRFAEAARQVHDARGGTLVLTGAAGDRALVDAVRARLGGLPAIDTTGTLDLDSLAALLASLDVFITGDTGPMHLAAAMGTPVVALFGPADPRRYGPRGSPSRVIRVDLPCSPCGLVRLPPARCRGHVPDCMDGIGIDVVVDAAVDLLDHAPRRERA